MESVQKLYKSDSYVAQQTVAIDQALSQIEVKPTPEGNVD
jgi:hypothetical protein